MKQTPQDKLNNKLRDNLRKMTNRISSAFSLKQVRTWTGVYKMEGLAEEDIKRNYPERYDKELTFAELKEHIAELNRNLETSIARRDEQSLESVEVLPQESNTKQAAEILQPTVTTPPIPQRESKVEEPIVVDAKSDYGYVKSPNTSPKFFPYWHQKKAIAELLDGVYNKKYRGQALFAGTGKGKTYIIGGVIRDMVDKGFADHSTFGIVKYLYVTRASVVEQAKRVFEKEFNLRIRDGVEVLNIEQLRSRAGQIWVKQEVIVEGGEEKTVWKWKKMVHPPVIFWDEGQSLKNEGSAQHQIAAAYNDIPDDTYQFFISATLLTRVADAKCFAVSTRCDISEMLGLANGSKLNNSVWPTYAASVAAPASPYDYNEASVDRLMNSLDKYIVRVKGVRSQFDAINKIMLINFKTDQERKFYEDTEKRYIEKKAKLMERLGKDLDEGGGIWELVLLNERCRSAEICRVEQLGELMLQSVKDGYAACCAAKFKGTIIGIVRYLVEKKGISRDHISLVWGGGQTNLTEKQKTRAAILSKRDKLEAAGMDVEDMLKSLELDDTQDVVLEPLPPGLRLGSQSKEERQKEIDRFQSGKTMFCLYTFKAGGVGLSLHHSDELSPVKVRRKESGFAYEEDIPKVPIRPRCNFVAPTYSAIELVQGLGRCPRLTSLSNTPQYLVYYRHTVEEGVAQIVSQKLRCLGKVVRQRESWMDVVSGGVKVEDHINNTKDLADDSPDDLGSDDEGEDE